MKTTVKKQLLLCLLLLSGWTGSLTANAQSGPGGEVTVGSNPDETPVPIDGGLVLLLTAGAGYGLKKYRAAARKKPQDQHSA